MTANKLISRLLKMVGFKVTWFNFNTTDNILELGVKPHKSGGRCPICGRRGKIIARTKSRQWDDVVVCGLRSVFFMLPAK